MTMHYGMPRIGFGGFYTRCGRLVVETIRWTANRRLATCQDCFNAE